MNLSSKVTIFVAYTMFYVRRFPFDTCLDRCGGPMAILSSLNDETTVDVNWQRWMYTTDTRTLRYGNVLDAMVHDPQGKYLRDGMIEHAWERIFACMIRSHNMRVDGLS
jgi:hypothetical protein